MKYSNDQIDEMILKGFNEEDKRYLDKMEEPNIIELYLETYKGKRKWLTILLTTVTFIMIVLTFYVATLFFKATDTKELLLWGFVFVTGLIAVTAMKIWFWMQMNNIAILREIKKLELQVAMKINK